MDVKQVKDSSVTLSHIFMPQDANPAGNVHGGVIVKIIDNAAAVVAFRHARCNVVTASVDKIDFFSPGYIGNLLTVKASINMVGRSSMEIGVRAETEDLLTGEIRHVVSAYLTFVAIDENGKPTKIPGLIIKTQEEKRRNCEALKRKEHRLITRNSKNY